MSNKTVHHSNQESSFSQTKMFVVAIVLVELFLVGITLMMSQPYLEGFLSPVTSTVAIDVNSPTGVNP